MSQTLMQQLVDYEGHCCIYGYFKQNSNTKTSHLAARLGVSDSTVRQWRKRIADGEITCGYGASGKGICLHKHPRNTP